MISVEKSIDNIIKKSNSLNVEDTELLIKQLKSIKRYCTMAVNELEGKNSTSFSDSSSGVKALKWFLENSGIWEDVVELLNKWVVNTRSTLTIGCLKMQLEKVFVYCNMEHDKVKELIEYVVVHNYRRLDLENFKFSYKPTQSNVQSNPDIEVITNYDEVY